MITHSVLRPVNILDLAPSHNDIIWITGTILSARGADTTSCCWLCLVYYWKSLQQLMASQTCASTCMLHVEPHVLHCTIHACYMWCHMSVHILQYITHDNLLLHHIQQCRREQAWAAFASLACTYTVHAACTYTCTCTAIVLMEKGWHVTNIWGVHSVSRQSGVSTNYSWLGVHNRKCQTNRLYLHCIIKTLRVVTFVL